MGWAFGTNSEGREVGYGVGATCDEPGCDADIDRGLAYVCGGMHDGGTFGCGGYFCGDHRFFFAAKSGELTSLCARCKELHRDKERDD